MLKSGPDQIEFGHVCEDPHEWQQRYEKKDLAKQRHQGQVASWQLVLSPFVVAAVTGTGSFATTATLSLFVSPQWLL